MDVQAINMDVEKHIVSQLRQGCGHWMELLLIAVDKTISDDQTMNMLVAMEAETIRLAKELHYDGIVVVNSHPVTMVINFYFA